jgi:hypothetical protein
MSVQVLNWKEDGQVVTDLAEWVIPKPKLETGEKPTKARQFMLQNLRSLRIWKHQESLKAMVWVELKIDWQLV